MSKSIRRKSLSDFLSPNKPYSESKKEYEAHLKVIHDQKVEEFKSRKPSEEALVVPTVVETTTIAPVEQLN